MPTSKKKTNVTPQPEIMKIETRPAADYADSQSSLADAIGINRRQVIRHLKDGAPAKTARGYHVESWRDWLSEKGKKGGIPKDVIDAINLEKLRGLKIKNDRLSAILIEKAEVQRAIATFAFIVRQETASRNSSLAARCIGKTAGQVLDMLTESDREMWAKVCAMPWNDPPGAPSVNATLAG
jgi:hypothetical protein